MPAADVLAQLQAAQQAAADMLAADQATIDALQTQVAGAQARYLTDETQLAAQQATITALSAQVAALQARPVGGLVPVMVEDFTAPAINTARWNVRNGDTSNNTNCIYFPANVTVQADGVHLTAKRQAGLSKPYSSGYLDTIGKCSIASGRWEIVARFPNFRGAWPALWLRADNALGEIDIAEAVGGINGDDVETVHQSTNGDMDKSGFEYKPSGLDLTAWHTYVLERDPDGTLRWYVDGLLNRTRKPTDVDNQGRPMTWLNGPTFNSPLNLRINLQVGGSMPRSFGADVDNTSALPGDMVIRAVRIYKLT